jgi:hypothetical protein
MAKAKMAVWALRRWVGDPRVSKMNRSFAFALGLTVGFPLFAHAEQHDGSYYCAAEFVGGVATMKL